MLSEEEDKKRSHSGKQKNFTTFKKNQNLSPELIILKDPIMKEAIPTTAVNNLFLNKYYEYNESQENENKNSLSSHVELDKMIQKTKIKEENEQKMELISPELYKKYVANVELMNLSDSNLNKKKNQKVKDDLNDYTSIQPEIDIKGIINLT